ncbi:ganglioside GM2 activator-like [Hyperolius riggenbachi]|uniref:ganglioside GM2 activator-like n=1 Tax=Hyperolius riggenbachi TaxID=752182 RepID=UPI0035A36D39
MLQMWSYAFLACLTLGHVSLGTATGVVINRAPVRVLGVNGFSWSNCGAETLPGKIQALTILPDPLVIPGEMTTSVILNTTVGLTSPVKIAVTAQKEMVGKWLTIPCLDGFGSCTYDDFCDNLDQMILPGLPCPEPLRSYGIPCHCPFQPGTYYLPVSQFYIPSLSLPYWFTDGNYRLTIVVSSGGQEVGCGEITFSLVASLSQWL